MTHKTWNYTRARSVVSDNLDTMDILAKCGLDKKNLTLSMESLALIFKIMIVSRFTSL